MSTGKIKTLFSDKEKTEALFPRTKTSAVSNSEGKGLDAILENLPYFSDADSSNVASVPMNADTLGGHPASDFALAYDVENMTAADVGAAPSGYGLGTTSGMSKITTQSVLDSTVASGWYDIECDIGEYTDFFNSPISGVLRVDAGTSFIRQTIYTSNDGFHTLTRYKVGTSWEEWEWENPYLARNKYYRTTERFRHANDLEIAVPVYWKLDDDYRLHKYLLNRGEYVEITHLLSGSASST